MSNPQKTVLITGCSAGGIGHAVALAFHAEGFRVFATARTSESMAELDSRGIETLQLDVTNQAAIRTVRDTIAIKTGGRLDILVNNAGQAYPVAITDMEMDRVREIFEVNLFAPMVMVQEFVDLLIASGNARIVQIGSVNGIMPVPFSAAYNTSKAGLHSFCDTARVELAPFKIKVINMLTGGVRSNISRNATLPDDSLYTLMEDLYQERRIDASQKGAIPTETYAGLVVRECIKADPRAWVWAGKNSFLVWFMETFLPRTAFDRMMNRIFGLDQFVARLSRSR